MSYTSRCYEKVDGMFGPPHETAPVVVLVVEGHHDVSRLVQALNRGTCEQVGVGERIVRQLKRRNSGRDALLLLKRHGGMDFTEDDAEDPVLAQRDALLELARCRGRFMRGGDGPEYWEEDALIKRCQALGLEV